MKWLQRTSNHVLSCCYCSCHVWCSCWCIECYSQSPCHTTTQLNNLDSWRTSWDYWSYYWPLCNSAGCGGPDCSGSAGELLLVEEEWTEGGCIRTTDFWWVGGWRRLCIESKVLAPMSLRGWLQLRLNIVSCVDFLCGFEDYCFNSPRSAQLRHSLISPESHFAVLPGYSQPHVNSHNTGLFSCQLYACRCTGWWEIKEIFGGCGIFDWVSELCMQQCDTTLHCNNCSSHEATGL